jgi:hypothetical protein
MPTFTRRQIVRATAEGNNFFQASAECMKGNMSRRVIHPRDTFHFPILLSESDL